MFHDVLLRGPVDVVDDNGIVIGEHGGEERYRGVPGMLLSSLVCGRSIDKEKIDGSARERLRKPVTLVPGGMLIRPTRRCRCQRGPDHRDDVTQALDRQFPLYQTGPVFVVL